jgi:uncharacterized cupredoxin-like copper-binding protein
LPWSWPSSESAPAGGACGVLPKALALAGLLVLGWAVMALAGSGDKVPVDIKYSRFEPDEIRIEAGQEVTFVIYNDDPIDHEFILGDAIVQARHEQGRQRQHHGEVPGERSVPAGQEAATTYAFPASLSGRTLEFACHLPGHYAYGMHGTVRVSGR